QTAAVTLELAQLDLQKYLQGDYEQARKDVDGRLYMAESDLKMWRERVAWSQRLVKKGYLTPNQMRNEQGRTEAAAFALQGVGEEKRVLTQFTKHRIQTELERKLAVASHTLDQMKLQALAKASRANGDRLAKRRILNRVEWRYRMLEEQIQACTLRAP